MEKISTRWQQFFVSCLLQAISVSLEDIQYDGFFQCPKNNHTFKKKTKFYTLMSKRCIISSSFTTNKLCNLMKTKVINSLWTINSN